MGGAQDPRHLLHQLGRCAALDLWPFAWWGEKSVDLVWKRLKEEARLCPGWQGTHTPVPELCHQEDQGPLCRSPLLSPSLSVTSFLLLILGLSLLLEWTQSGLGHVLLLGHLPAQCLLGLYTAFSIMTCFSLNRLDHYLL